VSSWPTLGVPEIVGFAVFTGAEREETTSVVAELNHRARRLYWLNPEPHREWDTMDSRASEYGAHCTGAFEVSTIRQLTAAVTQIV